MHVDPHAKNHTEGIFIQALNPMEIVVQNMRKRERLRLSRWLG
jgi:hypothetical protein